MTQVQTIDAILAAARKDVPNIVEQREYLCSDGQYRKVFGIPNGVTMTDKYRFFFTYHDGSSAYGKRFESVKDAISNWERLVENSTNEFRTVLEGMNQAELSRQAEYWLKS